MGPWFSKMALGLSTEEEIEPYWNEKTQEDVTDPLRPLDYEQVCCTAGLLDLQSVRVKQGVHEMEICLHSASAQHRQQQALVSRCRKAWENPNHHASFIPVKEFSIDNLPTRYRTEDILDFLKLCASLTVRISVTYTSPKRSGSSYVSPSGQKVLRLGTGWVGHIMKDCVRHDIPCPFPDCKESREPHTVSWPVFVNTAHHVVYNSAEAEQTSVEFFYDSTEDLLNQKVMRAQGVHAYTDAGRDTCVLECVTHDRELLQRLQEISHKLRSLTVDVGDREGEEKDMVVIVSHPHGTFKHVSIGWCQAVETRRKQLEEETSTFEEEHQLWPVQESEIEQGEEDQSFHETWPEEEKEVISSKTQTAGHETDHRKTSDKVEESEIVASGESGTEKEHRETSTKKGAEGDTTQPAMSEHKEWCRYTYTTPTCRGSSGAPVLVAGTSGAFYYLTPHCEEAGRSGEGLVIQRTGNSGTQGKTTRIQKQNESLKSFRNQDCHILNPQQQGE